MIGWGDVPSRPPLVSPSVSYTLTHKDPSEAFIGHQETTKHTDVIVSFPLSEHFLYFPEYFPQFMTVDKLLCLTFSPEWLLGFQILE